MKNNKLLNSLSLVFSFLFINGAIALLALWINISLFDNKSDILMASTGYFFISLVTVGSLYVIFFGLCCFIKFIEVKTFILLLLVYISLFFLCKINFNNHRFLRCHIEGCEGQYPFQN